MSAGSSADTATPPPKRGRGSPGSGSSTGSVKIPTAVKNANKDDSEDAVARRRLLQEMVDLMMEDDSDTEIRQMYKNEARTCFERYQRGLMKALGMEVHEKPVSLRV